MELFSDLFSIINSAWHSNVIVDDYINLARKFCMTAILSIVTFYIGFFAHLCFRYLKKRFTEEQKTKNRIWLYLTSTCCTLVFSTLFINAILLTIALYIALFKHLYLLIF